ncbi:MAG: hypothetical protein ACPGR2_09885 [Psychrobium sp.]
MKFKSLQSVDKNCLANVDIHLSFRGLELDDRCEFVAQRFKQDEKKENFVVNFCANSMTFSVNENRIKFRDLNSRLSELISLEEKCKIALDATSLGVVELLFLLRWLMRESQSLDIRIIYVEPDNYPNNLSSGSNFGRHEFNLSSSSVGYKSLPGFSKTASSSKKMHVIALLGFERVRLGQLLQNDEGAYIDSITPIFGVPGFKPSYDKHSAFQNIKALIDKGETPRFSSANNPFTTYQELEFIRSSMPDEIINVAPIGTKPMAIGACIFLLNNQNSNVGLLFDHPQKNKGRTKGISKVHIYSLCS